MFVLCALLLATALVTVGYFVLFASCRTEGKFRTFGHVLGAWLFILALLPLIGAGYAAVSGHHSAGMWGKYGHMQGGRGMGEGHRGPMQEGMQGRMEDLLQQHLKEMHGK